jgi:hypothetical protein
MATAGIVWKENRSAVLFAIKYILNFKKKLFLK